MPRTRGAIICVHLRAFAVDNSASLRNRLIPGDDLLLEAIGDFGVAGGEVLRLRGVIDDVEEFGVFAVTVDEEFPFAIADSQVRPLVLRAGAVGGAEPHDLL